MNHRAADLTLALTFAGAMTSRNAVSDNNVSSIIIIARRSARGF
jgi:hypothetical protein